MQSPSQLDPALEAVLPLRLAVATAGVATELGEDRHDLVDGRADAGQASKKPKKRAKGSATGVNRVVFALRGGPRPSSMCAARVGCTAELRN